MRFEIWLKNTSLPRIHDKVLNSYQEEELFCLQFQDKIIKYPTASIFTIIEYIDSSTVASN